MVLVAIAGLAAGAPLPIPPVPEAGALVVRVDDREGHRISAPHVTVIYADGTTRTLAALDNGATSDDTNARDHLWVARFEAVEEGLARVLVTDGAPQDATVAWLDKQIKVREDKVTRFQLEVPVSAASAALAAPTEVAPTTARPTDFPITEAARIRGEPIRIGDWDPVHFALLAAFAVVGLVALNSVHRRTTRARELMVALLTPDAGAVKNDPRAVRGWTAVVVAGMVALWCVVWIPGILTLRHRFLGIEHVDHYGTQWFYWFVEYALRNMSNPAVSDRFFFPWGKDLYAHTGANILDAYFALPLRLLLGHVAGYNVFVVMGTIANGLAFYSLARDYTEDRLAAGVSSLLFSLFPYMLVEFQEGRPTQAIVVLPVLFIKYTLRSARQAGWSNAVKAGLLLAATGYQYWFYAIFGGIVCFCHGVWRTVLPQPGSGGRLRTLARHGVMAVVAILLAAPVALPLAMRSTSGEVEGLLDTDRWSLWSSPPVTIEGQYIAIFAWQPLRRYAGFLLQDSDDQEERFIEEKLSTPWVLLPLVLVYLFRPHRFPRGSFLAMMVAALFIASGPVFLVGDYALPNPPYIYLVKAIGVFKRLWWPQRMVLFLAIPTLLALSAVLSWLGRTSGPRLQAIVSLGVLVAWAGDMVDGTVLPFPTWNARVPAGYQCLAQRKEGAIIELPFAWTQAHVYYQTVHEHAMLGGMLEDNVSFTPAPFTKFRTQNTFVKGIYEAADAETTTLEYTETDAQAVRELGYRYVVVQKDAWNELSAGSAGSRLGALLALTKTLDVHLGMPVYDDSRIAIYAPWGDPTPCDLTTIEPDRAAIGKMESTPNAREPDIDKQLYTRL